MLDCAHALPPRHSDGKIPHHRPQYQGEANATQAIQGWKIVTQQPIA